MGTKRKVAPVRNKYFEGKYTVVASGKQEASRDIANVNHDAPGVFLNERPKKISEQKAYRNFGMKLRKGRITPKRRRLPR